MKSLKRQLEAIVGPEYVWDDPASRWIYARDASPLPPAYPDFVVAPGNVEEVQEVLRLANRTATPVYTRCSGSNLWGGCIPVAGGLVLDLRRLNRILSIDPELFSCTVEPAVTFAQLQEALSRHGYYNLVTPEGAASACVGGSFVAHGDGIGSALWGSQGDAVLGCRVVLPSGEVVTTGSAANPEAAAVAGGSGQFFRYAYANDLTGLFCGSEGTLGVVVEITLRIERLPERYGFAAYGFERAEQACRVLYRARQRRLAANFAALRERASLAAVQPGDYPDAQLIYILEGDAPVVEYQLEVLDRLVTEEGGIPLPPKLAEDYWEKRFSLVPGMMYKLGSRALLPLHYPLGRLPWYYQRIRELCDELITRRYGLAYFLGGFQVGTCFVCYPTIMFLEQYPEQYETVTKCARETQAALLKLGGAPIQIGRLWSGAMVALGEHYRLLKKLKETIDPHNIMNPGLLDFPLSE